MGGVVKRNVEDVMYEAVDANLVGGVLVISSTTATESGLQGMKVAGDAAVGVLGVVIKDCLTAANRDALTNGTTPLGFPFADASLPTATSAVYNDYYGAVTYTAVAVAHGVPLCAAAGGKVRAWVSGTDPVASRIGWCAQPGGVSSAGGPARARILV